MTLLTLLFPCDPRKFPDSHSLSQYKNSICPKGRKWQTAFFSSFNDYLISYESNLSCIYDLRGKGIKAKNTYIVVQSLSHVQLCDPMDCSMLGFPVLHCLLIAQTHEHYGVDDTINHLILCCPLLFLPSIFPTIKIFPNELALCNR